MDNISPAQLPKTGGSLFASAFIFALPALTLSTRHGLGASLGLLLLIFLCCARRGTLQAYKEHWNIVGATLFAFAGYFLLSLGRMILDHQGLNTLDGPSRMLLGLSAIGAVYFLRPKARPFWLGLCVGAIAAALIAIWQVEFQGMDRAVGPTHHAITFGDLAMAMGLMALCGLSEFRHTRYSFLPVLALLCGLIASILSASRGGWLALLLVLVPLVRFGRDIYGKRLLVACGVTLGLFALAIAIPSTGVAHRIGLAVDEVQRWFALNDATTSVGIRLELWKAAWMMFSQHPLLGVGRDEFDTVLHAMASQGLLQQSPALTYSSAHNDVLHTLATGGLVDFVLLIAMYAAPLMLFARLLNAPDRGQRPLALAGVILVLSFVGFGLTDVMFWLMTPKIFYITMIGTLAALCLRAQQGEPPLRRILVTRTDNIGDVVLTLPMVGYLKQQHPEAEISLLCRTYASGIVAQCEHVDKIVTVEAAGDLATHMRETEYDTVIFAFPTRKMAATAARARIWRRVGTSGRLYNWIFCNMLANFSRVKSSLHEAQLNFKLLKPLGMDFVPSLDKAWRYYGLSVPHHPDADALLAKDKFNLILHPKSNGNGREWPLAHFTTLARLLRTVPDVQVLVTGSPAEGKLLAEQAPELLALPNVKNVCGKLDLTGFTALIGGCDGLIASGTGPLHVAAALGRPTAGLFPPVKPIDPARWGALGERAMSLVQPKPCAGCDNAATCECMQALKPEWLYEVVMQWRREKLSAASQSVQDQPHYQPQA
jgi:ADP-heptose:LPS heptosyltransferase/O-antigen ligase